MDTEYAGLKPEFPVFEVTSTSMAGADLILLKISGTQHVLTPQMALILASGLILAQIPEVDK